MRPTLSERLSQGRQQELGHAVGAGERQPRQGVLDLGILKALQKRTLVCAKVNAWYRWQQWGDLFVHHALEQSAQSRIRRRLVDKAMPSQMAEIGHRLMARVEQAQFHRFVRVHISDDLHAQLFERRATERERVFDHPLSERFGHYWPGIRDSKLGGYLGAVGICRLRRDSIDHRVG